MLALSKRENEDNEEHKQREQFSESIWQGSNEQAMNEQ